jgi:hypothetical protein
MAFLQLDDTMEIKCENCGTVNLIDFIGWTNIPCSKCNNSINYTDDDITGI